MNTLSKALIAVCLLLSAVVFARWESTPVMENKAPVDAAGTPVAIATSSDGKTVYYSCLYRLYKSTDGGETWTVLK